MNAIVIDFILEFSYIALFLFIAIENIFPPIPSEIILGSAGFLCALDHMNIFVTIICSVCATLCGSYLLYLLGSRFDRDSMISFFTHKGKWMRISPHHVGKAFDVFDRHGYLSVFFLRFVPIVRSLISIPAGMSHMRLSIFLLLSGVASLCWNTFIIGIGYITQENYSYILHQFTYYFKEILFVLLIVLLVGLIIYQMVKRFSHE